MTTKSIVESGMTFGPYPDGHCFHIEGSKTYSLIQQNVRMAEFLLFRLDSDGHPTVLIIEAKSSSPRPENQEKFEQFVNDTRDKLVNAFSLGWASCLGRHQEAETELPETFKKLNLAKTEVRFVVVINGHDVAWLPPLNDAMIKALKPTIKTWSFAPTSVIVINDTQARQYGLILTQGGI